MVERRSGCMIQQDYRIRQYGKSNSDDAHFLSIAARLRAAKGTSQMHSALTSASTSMACQQLDPNSPRRSTKSFNTTIQCHRLVPSPKNSPLRIVTRMLLQSWQPCLGDLTMVVHNGKSGVNCKWVKMTITQADSRPVFCRFQTGHDCQYIVISPQFSSSFRRFARIC